MADRPGKAADLPGRRILVVEDEGLLAMEMQDELERRGCIVVGPASTVDDALGLIGAEQFDLAVLDLNLGGQASTPVAEALAANGVPFVIMSGYDRLAETIPAGTPVLEKPVDYKKLVEALVRALGAHRTAQAG